MTWAKRNGYRASNGWTAGELCGHTVYVSYGHVGGVERFGRETLVRGDDGKVHVMTEEGATVLIHPDDRRLRILVK